MKIHTIKIGLALLVLLGCSDDNFDVNDFPDDSSITTLQGTWKVVSFENFIQETVEFKSQENSWGLDIIISFNDTVDPNLLSGQVTTNGVQGKFEYIDERHFKLLEYFTTFMGQPEWADKFGNALHGENITYKVNNDRLRIYYENKTKSMTLTKE